MKVLITGTSGGFGKLIVQSLLEKGYTVVATMRGVNGKNAEAAAELTSAGAHVVEIDVTDNVSVTKGMQQAIDQAGGLDVVINNAGVGVMGLQEAFTPEDWQRLFDINVFGVQRVCRAVLPHFRAKGSGLLIHVSSLLGRFVLPFYGPYNASKYALEALAENYRVELSGFGVESCLVEPGGFPTNFFDNLMMPGDTARLAEYGEFADAPMQSAEGFGEALANNPQQTPQIVADAILELLAMPAGERPFRTVVDKMGMGDPISAYNESAEQVTHGIYSAFGMDGMLKLQQ